MNPKVIFPEEREYRKLEAVAAMLETRSPNGAIYEVKNVYFDFGQDWMWTTICRRGFHDCQVLTPRDWNNILLAETPHELADAAEAIVNGDWFGDKERRES